MKKALLLFLLAALSVRVNAQTTFAPQGATWHFGQAPQDYYHARASGTVMQEGRSCTIIRFYEHHLGYPPQARGSITTCVSGDTVLYLHSKGRLVPLYIYNVRAGDTIPFYNANGYSAADSFLRVRIDSVKPMLWGNTMLRTVWGQTVSASRWSNDWHGYNFWDTASNILYVERLGAVYGNGLLPWAAIGIPEAVGRVACYYDGSTDARLDAKDSCTGIPEAVSGSTLPECAVYPNPAHGFCRVQFSHQLPDGARLTAYDLTGSKYAAITLPNGASAYELDMRNWPSGIYLLEVSSGAGKLHWRLMKE